MEDKRKLCRSMSDKAILGVCSGFAKYFDIDPIVMRLVVVLLALLGTIGVWFYILAAIIMPKDTDFIYTQARYDTETGRPLYQAGGTVYENRAGGPQAQETPYQDVEFTATDYNSAETVQDSDAAGGTSEAAGDTTGSWTQKTYQAYQPQQPQPQTNHRSRNTGILFIIIGVVILAKIFLPKINIWIPIAIAAIFFGIYLCCRKK